MEIEKNIVRIKNALPLGVKLSAGQKVFGENKVQELVSKWEQLPQDIEWHFIGHLQTNKVKYIAPFVWLLHGVDSLKLLKVINTEAAKNNRKINCLLQFHVAEEETKFGLSLTEAKEILESSEIATMQNIILAGIMGMATFTDDVAQIRREFRELYHIFTTLKNEYFIDKPSFEFISMGMSDDYEIAVSEGSNLVRVGSKIFGDRDYMNTLKS